MGVFQCAVPPGDVMTTSYRDADNWQTVQLLKETSSCRDGRQRVTIPDRNAIMRLACSHEKRASLGRKQQLLLDIARRCREQDVATLSSTITKKCAVPNEQHDPHNIDIAQKTARKDEHDEYTERISKLVDIHLGDTAQNSLAVSEEEPRPEFERENSSFPSRKIRKQMSPRKAESFPKLSVSLSPKHTSESSRNFLARHKYASLNVASSRSEKSIGPKADSVSLPSIRSVDDHCTTTTSVSVDSFVIAKSLPITPKCKSMTNLQRGHASTSRPAMDGLITTSSRQVIT